MSHHIWYHSISHDIIWPSMISQITSDIITQTMISQYWYMISHMISYITSYVISYVTRGNTFLFPCALSGGRFPAVFLCLLRPGPCLAHSLPPDSLRPLNRYLPGLAHIWYHILKIYNIACDIIYDFMQQYVISYKISYVMSHVISDLSSPGGSSPGSGGQGDQRDSTLPLVCRWNTRFPTQCSQRFEADQRHRW